jgi:hypothetical protein
MYGNKKHPATPPTRNMPTADQKVFEEFTY